MEENSETSVQYPTVEESQGWVYFKELDPIPDNLLGLSVCTMDFKARPRYTVAALPGDRAFHNLIRNPRLIKQGFIIKRDEIMPFLTNLERATGGKGTFRFLSVNSGTIRDGGWDLKFLNFYLNPVNSEEFIVCNKHSRAIRWRDIIPTIRVNLLDWHNNEGK